jgi:hypothetical protein
VADESSDSKKGVLAHTEGRYVLRSFISDVITSNDQKWQQTPERARQSRRVLNGDQRAPIAAGFANVVENIEAFRVRNPAQFLKAYHQRNVAAKDRPRLKRYRRNESEDGKTEATTIEQIMQAVMDNRRHGYPWRDSVDIIQNESVAICIVLPETAAMSRTPSLYEPGTKDTIRERYQRNAGGKPKTKDDKTWRLSKKASAKVHDAEVRDFLARQAFVQFDVLGPTSFIPVFGPGLKLDAVVVERFWTYSDLQKNNLFFDGMQGHLSPSGSARDGFTSERGQVAPNTFKVTELYATDWLPGEEKDGGGCHPYVAYMIDGGPNKSRIPLQRQTKSGDWTDILDLRAEYGIKRLPVALRWGSQFATPEYDQRGMTFTLPFEDSWAAIDAILTGATVWAWWRGFPTLIEEPNANTTPDVGTLSDTPEDKETTEIAPLSIIRTNGTIKELGSQGPAPIVMQLVQFLSGEAEKEGPPSAAFGGDGGSGFQASLARTFADDAMSDIKDGALGLYCEAAEIAFETLTGIAEKTGPVPIEQITPVPLGKRAQEGQTRRKILDLDKNLAGGLYNLEAEYPPTPNLAKGQQWAEWVQLGLVLLEEFREEIIGDPNPEIFIARRLKQRIMDSPEFQAKIMALVAQLEGDAESKRQLMALVSGQAEQGSDGMVRPAIQGQMLGQVMAGSPMPQPALTGAGGGPSFGGSALGGAIGGPMAAATQAATAGGTVPDNLTMGPTG